MALYSYMAAHADEHNWLFAYSLLAPRPGFSPLLCVAKAGSTKGFHLLPCQLASWKVLQHQALEREWKVRERRDFVSSFCQHHTSFSARFSVHSPRQPPRTSLDMLPSEPHSPGHQNAHRCAASPARLPLTSDPGSSPPCQAPSPSS